MTTAVSALQDAVLAALRADSGVRALLNVPAKIYEMVPSAPEHPFVALGETQDVPDPAECIDGSEIFLTFHIWSRSDGTSEVTDINAAFDAVLHDADLTLAGNACVLIERGGFRLLKDPDGLSIHGVATYRALVEPMD